MKHQKYKSFFCFWVSVWMCSCCLYVICYFILDQTTYFGWGNRGSLLCSNSHVYNIFKQRMMPIHELFGVNFKTKIMWLAQQKWFVTLWHATGFHCTKKKVFWYIMQLDNRVSRYHFQYLIMFVEWIIATVTLKRLTAAFFIINICILTLK